MSWIRRGLLIACLLVTAADAQERPGVMASFLSAQLQRVAEAAPAQWPQTRASVEDAMREKLEERSYDDGKMQNCLAAAMPIVDEAHEMPRERYMALKSTLCIRVSIALKVQPPLQALLFACCSTPDDQWPAFRTGVLEFFGASFAPSKKQQALEKLAAILDACRAGSGTTVGSETPNYLERMREAIGSGRGKNNPGRRRRGVNWHMWKQAAIFALVLIGPPIVMWLLRRRGIRPTERRWAAVLATCLWTALGVEAGCRLLISIRPVLDRMEAFTETWLRNAWVQSHLPDNGLSRTSEKNAFDPRRGWAVEPNLRNWEIPVNKLGNSNSRGLRGVQEYEYRKPPGKTRVLVFGDSFTFGDEASDDETYAYFMQQRLADTEVLNFGVRGYGHDQMLIYLQDEGVKYQADVVILGFIPQDVERNTSRFTFAAKPCFVESGDGLLLTGVPVSPPEQVLRDDAWRCKSLEVVAMLRDHERLQKEGRRVVLDPARAVTVAILDQFVRVVRGMGATPVIAYFPDGIELSGGTRTEAPLVERFCRERSVAYLSLLDAMRKGREDGRVRRVMRFPRHWVASEAHLVADTLCDFLESRGVAARKP